MTVGDSKVGTTCLLFAYIKEFPSSYAPVWQDSSEVDIEVDGACIELGLYLRPTSFDGPPSLFYNKADVVLICFSVDMPESLESIPNRWVPELKEHCPNVPYLVVATKTDLREELTNTEAPFVQCEAGREVAESVGAWGYCECSALRGEGVAELFQSAARAALLHREESSRAGKLRRALGQQVDRLKSALGIRGASGELVVCVCDQELLTSMVRSLNMICVSSNSLWGRLIQE